MSCASTCRFPRNTGESFDAAMSTWPLTSERGAGSLTFTGTNDEPSALKTIGSLLAPSPWIVPSTRQRVGDHDRAAVVGTTNEWSPADLEVAEVEETNSLENVLPIRPWSGSRRPWLRPPGPDLDAVQLHRRARQAAEAVRVAAVAAGSSACRQSRAQAEAADRGVGHALADQPDLLGDRRAALRVGDRQDDLARARVARRTRASRSGRSCAPPAVVPVPVVLGDAAAARRRRPPSDPTWTRTRRT